MVTIPDAIFVRRHQGRSGYHDEVFHDDEHVVRTVTRILDGASGSHRKLDAAEGLQDAQLESGARLHIVHGDVARVGQGGLLPEDNDPETTPLSRSFAEKPCS